jgi:hypothetical protein
MAVQAIAGRDTNELPRNECGGFHICINLPIVGARTHTKGHSGKCAAKWYAQRNSFSWDEKQLRAYIRELCALRLIRGNFNDKGN